MKNRKKIKVSEIVPFAAFVVLFVFFTIVSKGRMVSAYSLKMLLEQSILTIVTACGVLFVVAQGSIDLSVGVNVAMSGVIGMHIAAVTGVGWLMVPCCMLVGLLIGLLNGFLVSKCHVPSFTLSIAMLIGLRGIVNYIQTIIGIEYVPEAIEDAKINSQLNDINNTSFFAGDMKDILTDEFIAEHGRPNVIITDPPRAGMHGDVVDTILRAAPQRIVYVSCNPATQARDLQLLDVAYRVAKIQPVDMFPHTQHVENVVLLEKR